MLTEFFNQRKQKFWFVNYSKVHKQEGYAVVHKESDGIILEIISEGYVDRGSFVWPLDKPDTYVVLGFEQIGNGFYKLFLSHKKDEMNPDVAKIS